LAHQKPLAHGIRLGHKVRRNVDNKRQT